MTTLPRPDRAGQHGPDNLEKNPTPATKSMKKSDMTQVESGIRIEPDQDLENRVMALRESGLTFKEAGKLLDISASRARHLYLRASRRRAGRKPLWTDGLNDRLAKLLRWLEFNNRDEVAQAYMSGHIQRLALRERGINAANLLELEQWLNAGVSQSRLSAPGACASTKHATPSSGAEPGRSS